uniref:Macrophage immunometabolism regulator n=1 Tax=Oryctolagus cuniculus TaxID=9986 RepID=A0A5F9DT78_RABIT
MEVDINGEPRSTLSTLPLPVAEASSPGKAEAEKPRCSSTPCSPMRRTVSGYQILHMDSNYLVGFTTGEELLKLAQKCSGGEEGKGEGVPSLRSKQLDAGLARSSRVYKGRSRYYQPYEIPAVNGRRRRRMPSSGDKCTKSLPYEPYKALHGPLPLCLLKEKTVPFYQSVAYHRHVSNVYHGHLSVRFAFLLCQCLVQFLKYHPCGRPWQRLSILEEAGSGQLSLENLKCETATSYPIGSEAT